MSKSIAKNQLDITKDRVKAWDACAIGYRWFIGKFPQGAEFAEVYAALQADKRYSDSKWLSDHVFAELDTPTKVQQTVLISGADKLKIEKYAQETDTANGAATTGEGANAATTGEGANAATTGEGANAATTGKGANAATTGEWANAATTGYQANAATTGDQANAATTGDWANAATTGKGAIAAVLGKEGKAKSGVGGAIVIAHRDINGNLLGVKTAMIGENGIKSGVWYKLDKSGLFVEAEDE